MKLPVKETLLQTIISKYYIKGSNFSAITTNKIIITLLIDTNIISSACFIVSQCRQFSAYIHDEIPDIV